MEESQGQESNTVNLVEKEAQEGGGKRLLSGQPGRVHFGVLVQAESDM